MQDSSRPTQVPELDDTARLGRDMALDVFMRLVYSALLVQSTSGQVPSSVVYLHVNGGACRYLSFPSDEAVPVWTVNVPGHIATPIPPLRETALWIILGVTIQQTGWRGRALDAIGPRVAVPSKLI
jgi:hypothetical protein